MAVYEGVYKSLLQGVSQQTPQERQDGQLGSQVNMLSDPVTGLRRRSGIKYIHHLDYIYPESYIRIVKINGAPREVVIDTVRGRLSIFGSITASTPTVQTFTDDYFKATHGKISIRTTSTRGNFFIVNTEKVPQKSFKPDVTLKDPRLSGYFSVRGSEFSKPFTVTVSYGVFSKTYTVTAHANNASEAAPESIATRLMAAMSGDGMFSALFSVAIRGTTVAITVTNKASFGQLDVETSTTGGYLLTSGVSRLNSKSELLGTLPSMLDDYIIAVGNTGNSAYYQYNDTTKRWSETGAYDKPYVITNQPKYFYEDDTGTIQLKSLDIQKRSAGDLDNNPEPKFIGYGITGIGAYQSRLVILSGSYVNLSKTTDFNQFMRTSVTELLDDDPIEVSSAAISSAQFEYAVPYNKDLVLIAAGQQAVIPANSTVLTPKTAVIYPSTELDLSLAVEPKVVARSMYYCYQRGVDYYQVGEFIPNTYTEAQYYSQNITDHIPLYAQGVCTTMSASTTNNMVVMCSDTKEVLINQYLWQGDERPLMSFHKWVMPYKVLYADFVGDTLFVFMQSDAAGVLVGTINVQLNQLDDKPAPYVDNYQYLDVVNGKVKAPKDMPLTDLVAVIYDSATMRHKEVHFEMSGTDILCPYTGRIAFGQRYHSEFQLTPPFVKDNSGKVIAGSRSTIQQLRMTFKSTGSFKVKVLDTMGVAYDGEDNTALTWSETDLGYSWVNSIGSVVIPCRTRLSSTECTVSTNGTTDMNLVSTEYVLRMASKRRRL